ncbi:hypothetical protein HPB48_000760 [Haemaphysalis longicornis]|uniref:Uncharacterized protein n=1 Tax=Haemaphysalis longicornis TaxID=44386 RepID=A0A9J6GY52_HAELO|nr:hypothetical protein HPB48_000760 [Haemaphysalis longicornis]
MIRAPPRFPPAFWSAQPLAEQGLPRGNNSVESWHSRSSKVVGVSHPGVWRFISPLQQEQKATGDRLKARLSSQQPRKQRKAVLAKEAALERISKNVRDMPLNDFFRAIAHQLIQ